MVYGVCFAPLKRSDELKALGVAGMYVRVYVCVCVCVCSTSLRRTKYNLNMLSHDTAIMLLRCALAEGVRVREVYVDTVGKEDVYQRKLAGLFPELQVG